MAKAEISWKRTTPEGESLQCYAHHVGNRWIFYHREKRYDQWQEVKTPPLEDWEALLDSVRRRINRRLLQPEEEKRIEKAISELFPKVTKDQNEG